MVSWLTTIFSLISDSHFTSDLAKLPEPLGGYEMKKVSLLLLLLWSLNGEASVIARSEVAFGVGDFQFCLPDFSDCGDPFIPEIVVSPSSSTTIGDASINVRDDGAVAIARLDERNRSSFASVTGTNIIQITNPFDFEAVLYNFSGEYFFEFSNVEVTEPNEIGFIETFFSYDGDSQFASWTCTFSSCFRPDDYTGGSGTLEFDGALLAPGETVTYSINYAVSARAVPEPGSLGLIAVGLIGAALVMRRRRHVASRVVPGFNLEPISEPHTFSSR